MATREAHEYVRVDGHPIIISNLGQSSEVLAHGIDNAFEESDLIKQKHEKVAEAKRLVSELLENLQHLDRLMMHDTFRQALEKKEEKAPKSVVYREKAAKKRARPRVEEKNFLVKSEKALSNLQRNLEILKKQLK